MPWFSATEEPAERQDLRTMIEESLVSIGEMPDWQRTLAGLAINRLKADFDDSFPEVRIFRSLSSAARRNVISIYEGTTEELRQRDAVLGFGAVLFTFWLRAIDMDDLDLEGAIAPALEGLGKYAHDHPPESDEWK